MHKTYVILSILIALVILILIIIFRTHVIVEGWSWGGCGPGCKRHKAKKKEDSRRRARRDERQKWWNSGGYRLDGAGHGKKGINDAINLPIGFRQDYDAGVNKDIREWNDEYGCVTNELSEHCAKDSWSVYFKPIMKKIVPDARKQFGDRRINYYDDLKKIVMEKEGDNWIEKQPLYPSQTDMATSEKYEDVRNILMDANKKYDTSSDNYSMEHNSVPEATERMRHILNTDFIAFEKNRRNISTSSIKGGDNTKGEFVEEVGNEGFNTINAEIRYIDPRGRGIITDEIVWKKIRSEILNNSDNMKKLDSIQGDILDDKGNIIRSFDEFKNDYQSKYTELSSSLETTFENSARDNIRLKAAIFPSL